MRIGGKLMVVVGALLTFAPAGYAQQKDAILTNEFRLEEEVVTHPSGRQVTVWMLCLNEYRVLVSGQREYIPVFPIYTECVFATQRDRAVDVLERASNALDCMLHGEALEVLPPPKNGSFQGSSIWVVPANLDVEHPGLVLRVDEKDRPRFGFRAAESEWVAVYLKDIFEVMRALFLEHRNPSGSPAMTYPYVKILKRIWLDAQQHAEKIRKVPAERSAESVTQEDIQEAIDMLSESQRLRLLGIALLIPARG